MNGILQIVIGAVAGIAGVLLMLNRVRIADLNAGAQKRTFGRAARSSARNSTPANMAFVGAAAIVIGIGFVASGVTTLAGT